MSGWAPPEGPPDGSAEWWDAFYSRASGTDDIPWADLAPNPNLTAWLDAHAVEGRGRRALTVAAGLGDDAEELARRGFAVTAFDVAPTAVEWARRRFAGSAVDYRVADVLALPADWRRSFDLVVEAYTLQSLAPELLSAAGEAIAGTVAPGGTLLVVARGRAPGEPRGARPWPLTPDELLGLFPALEVVALDDYPDGEQQPVRRLRAELRRASDRPGA